MTGHYLLDRIEEAVLVVDHKGVDSVAKWLAINPYACQSLGCTQEDFLQHAEANIKTELLTHSSGEKSTILIHGDPHFEERTFQFDAFQDTLNGKACWVLIGQFLEQNLTNYSWDNYLMETAISHAITDAVIISDSDLKIQSWNKAAASLYGWKGDEAVGRTLGEVIPTIYLDEKRSEVLTQFHETGYWEGDVQQQHRNGNWMLIHAVVNTVKDASGKAIAVVAVNRDITSRRKIEKALNISEERLKLAGQAAYDLLYEWEPDTGKITWFGDIDQLLGLPKGSISVNTESLLALIHPDDQEVLRQAVRPHATHTEQIVYEFRVRHADGHYLHWRGQGLPILDDTGKPIKWIGICEDKTQEIQFIQQLTERDKLLRIIGENFPKAYLSIIYPDLTIGYTNGQEFKLRGIDPTQFVGLHTKDVFSAYGEEVVNTILAAYNKTFQGEPQLFELYLDGQVQQYNTVPIEGEKGEIESMLAVVRNVTEERTREIQIKESEEKFSKAFHEHAVPMLILHTHTGKRVDLNYSFVKLTGYSVKELRSSGTEAWDLCLDPACIHRITEKLNTLRRVHDYPVEMITKQGERKYLLANGAIMEVGSGDLAILSLEDITLKKQAEESLRESETRLRTLVETLPDLFWLKDPDGVFLACNKRFSALYNASEQEIIGKTDKDFVSEEVANIYRANDLQAISSDGPRINEEVLTFLSDGHTEHVETIKAPVYNDKGEVMGVLGIARDITGRIQQLEAIQRQNELLKNIAWMQSHEVRAPLTNIMGLIGLMEGKTKPSPEEQAFIYQHIIQAAHELDDIIRKIVVQTEEYRWASGEEAPEIAKDYSPATRRPLEDRFLKKAEEGLG